MKKILFEIAQDYYWPSFEPIYRTLAQDPEYELFLRLGPNQKRVLGIFLLSQKKKLEENYRSQGFKITQNTKGFHAVICGTPLKHPEHYGDALLVNVDHGPGIKTLRYRSFLKQPNTPYVVFVEGPYRVEKFQKYGLDKIETIYDVGLPKLDRFFDGSYDRERIHEQIGLDPRKKTVLYAPSYKPTSIYMIQDKLPGLLQEYNVIVKLHPYSWEGKYAPHKQHRIFERLAHKYPELYLVPRQEHNMMPYMFASDTMISDGSSVINEFLALGRVGIIFDLDDDNLKHSDGQPLLENPSSQWLKDSFIHIQSAKDLRQAVAEALAPSAERQKQLSKDRDYIFSYLDGRSAERVKEKLDQLITR